MEYECYLMDPATKMSHVEGEPLLKTNCLAEASGFIYKFWLDNKVDVCIYQSRIESYRGYYRAPKRDKKGRFA